MKLELEQKYQNALKIEISKNKALDRLEEAGIVTRNGSNEYEIQENILGKMVEAGWLQRDSAQCELCGAIAEYRDATGVYCVDCAPSWAKPLTLTGKEA